MGRLELLAQDLRRAERELKKAYIWLGVWCLIFVVNFIWGSWSFLMGLYNFRFLFWLFAIPILFEPFFYSFLFGVMLYCTLQEQWKKVEHCQFEQLIAEEYLDIEIRSVEAKAK